MDKQRETSKKLAAWEGSKVLGKADVILEAHAQKTPVHFATSMDLCHQKQQEMAEHLQTHEGRVVPRGDNVKHGSGLNAVFLERVAS